MPDTKSSYSWWSRQHRPYSVGELVADGIVHGLGLLVAIAAGSVLLAYAVFVTAPEAVPALLVYLGSLLAVLGVSMAYNLWPVSPVKKVLARFDQAAIFLFIAGSYTPFLAVMGGTTIGTIMTTFVWGASLIGVALKLIVPERFGRLAIVLYLAIGWSGILVFQSLAQSLPPTTMWLVLAGGVTYSLGIIFHLWEKLKFQNALWHVFVVAGASLHLWAVIDFMVIHRL
ncbi:hemolysin III family protein [Devosia sp. 2618]|uniref:PAQR family membrane homeostasis protein TrhA n=1 Tax=Devosia sp. 2618 TaxID=3156454 RepID=UPI00339ABB42